MRLWLGSSPVPGLYRASMQDSRSTWGTVHTLPTWGGYTTTLCCSRSVAPTPPWWSGRGSLWGPRRASWWTARSRTLMQKRTEVSEPHLSHAGYLFQHIPPHSPTPCHCQPTPHLSLSVVWGYDSDVAREKAIDYTTKIYAVSIREMEGTKPHQQLKEVSMEERYGVAGFACIIPDFNKTSFSLLSALLLKLVFCVYAQCLNLHTNYSWWKSSMAFNFVTKSDKSVTKTLCRSCLWNMTWIDIRFGRTRLPLAQRGCQHSLYTLWHVMANRKEGEVGF